jgi:hypothetical protein
VHPVRLAVLLAVVLGYARGQVRAKEVTFLKRGGGEEEEG